jgi:hypothetical protein
MPPKKVKSQGVRNELVSGTINVELSGTSSAGGEYVDYWNVVAGSQAWTGSPTISGGAKLTALADQFQFYRFTKMHARLVCVNSYLGTASYNKTNMVIAAEAYGVTAPSTFAMVSDSPLVSPLAVAQAGQSANATLVQLPPEGVSLDITPILRGQQVKWWRTVASGSVDDALEFQARVMVGGMTSVASQTVRPSLQITYTCEFKDFISASLTPALQESRARALLLAKGYSVLDGAVARLAPDQKSEVSADLVDLGDYAPPRLARDLSIDAITQALSGFSEDSKQAALVVSRQIAAGRKSVPASNLSSARK